MENNKLSILLISSESLAKRSSRLALDQYMALKKGGHSVDILTMYDQSDNHDVIAVCGEVAPPAKKLSFTQRVVNKIKSLAKWGDYKKGAYYFFYDKETVPPVPVEMVLSKITKQYDLVIITFWQGLLSAATVWEIYQKLKCPVIFAAVDMSPATGGCHYFWDCKRYEVGCGLCPALGAKKEKDFTRFNALYRHEHFSKMPCAFLGNNYMNESARKSFILQNVLVDNGALPINDEEFCVRDKNALRKEFDIDNTVEFVMFAGASALDEERKGFGLLIEALNKFYDTIDQTKRNKVLLLLAGVVNAEVANTIKFNKKILGFIDFDKLSRAYSASELFLCPSILDAGPMMVNQSLSCGVPVVSFEMGTSLEVVKGQGTGYCAKLADVDDFTRGIEYIFNLDVIDRAEMSAKCREIAMKTTSYEHFCHNTLRVYKKLLND